MKKMSYKIFYTFLLYAFVLVLPNLAYSQNNVTVVPSELADVAGNETGGVFPCFPFPNLRAQAVYLGSEVGGGEIISIVNRSEPFGAAYGPITLPNIRVVLSTTSANPDTLSNNFAENTGRDAVVVFEGDLTLSAPECTTSPCPFVSGQVDFQKSFIFNPANGNLLVDVSVPTCLPGITNGDMTDQFPEVTRAVVAVPFDSESGLISNTVLVTEFTTDPSALVTRIPTLSFWGLITLAGVMGLLGFIFLRRNKSAA